VPDFLALESSILTAIVDLQWGTLADRLDDDFVITTAGWLEQPATKQEWIAGLTSGLRLHRFAIDSVEEHDLGSVVVVLVLSTQTVTWEGEERDFRFRYTDVWRQRDDDWALAVRHASLVPAA
jgi:ketosteroid isomerase-like protein